MTLSLRNNFQNDKKREDSKASNLLFRKYNLNWKIVVLGVLALLFAVGLLAQVPWVSLWFSQTMGESASVWLTRLGLIAAVIAISSTLTRAFFAHVRKEFGIGPTPICAFFVLGFVLALLNSL